MRVTIKGDLTVGLVLGMGAILKSVGFEFHLWYYAARLLIRVRVRVRVYYAA